MAACVCASAARRHFIHLSHCTHCLTAVLAMCSSDTAPAWWLKQSVTSHSHSEPAAYLSPVVAHSQPVTVHSAVRSFLYTVQYCTKITKIKITENSSKPFLFTPSQVLENPSKNSVVLRAFNYSDVSLWNLGDSSKTHETQTYVGRSVGSQFNKPF